jgi:hypothetical protein
MQSFQGEIMPRKKKGEAPAESASAQKTETKVSLPPMQAPEWIEGPPLDENGRVIKSSSPSNDGQMELSHTTQMGKSWGPPYKAIFSADGFEMGEDRRFKQRVFKFSERPADEVLQALKDNGFSYRANEKAWTIQANAVTRTLSDDLAREFAGQTQGMAR